MIEQQSLSPTAAHDAEVVPTVRKPRFDWSDTSMIWIPGEPFASHLDNVLHLLLPTGERWFIEVVQKVMPRVTDEKLREQVAAFMGQESVHAQAHEAVLARMKECGIDPAPYLERLDFLLNRLFGEETPPRPLRKKWLEARVAAVAGLEHYTAVMGQWALDSQKTGQFERAGADPVMLDLFRWHGAEEVEHRAVVFDVYQHVSGNYAVRQFVMVAMATPLFLRMWVEGAKFLMENDPALPKEKWSRARVMREWRRVGKKGLAPPFGEVFGAGPHFLRPGYHPIKEGSTEEALAYLKISPGARGAYGNGD